MAVSKYPGKRNCVPLDFNMLTRFPLYLFNFILPMGYNNYVKSTYLHITFNEACIQYAL